MIPPGFEKILHAIDSFMASLSVLFIFGFVATAWRMVAQMTGG